MAELPPEWFPEHRDGGITPFAQAALYPYPVPDSDFLMERGLPTLVPGGIGAERLRGRVPVLSVGSNRSPLQLRRKFGAGASLPVTAAAVDGVDVVFASLVSYYGAVPATGFPCPGVRVELNIAWLDDGQLAHMHDTEARGTAYDFIRYRPGVVDHGARPDRDDPVFGQEVYGYEARAGVLGLDGAPVAHAAVKAVGRTFPEMDEVAMLGKVQGLAAGPDGSPADTLEGWVMALRGSRAAREEVMEAMRKTAIRPAGAPWEIIEGVAGAPDAYL